MAGFGVPGSLAEGLRIIPHPAMMVAVEFSATASVAVDGGGRRQRGSLVAGPGFGYGGAVRVWGENVECVQIRLSPVIAGAVLGMPPSELDGTMTTLANLWGAEASRIAERLSEAPTWEQRFALADALVVRRRSTAASVDPEVTWAWNRIVRSRGRVRVERLASELGWSRKRLWSRFGSQIGLTPKRAARLVRFDHAAHRLVAGHDPATVAAEVGFADQSHLHRDIVAFTAATPSAMTGEPFLTIDDKAWPVRG
ncbi:transcriptional regulator, AraC family [Stackebrandtia nassauensis DSM 44728]|uniref:Transcriptional regulator, AraC family n=2 Tax=Stackebrandtia TaxID=283810 RepID=D3Q7A1_STANL|nr:transcriptional regulator, AraC family [Stackebrandtia nassauensis DSM 44728]